MAGLEEKIIRLSKPPAKYVESDMKETPQWQQGLRSYKLKKRKGLKKTAGSVSGHFFDSGTEDQIKSSRAATARYSTELFTSLNPFHPLL